MRNIINTVKGISEYTFLKYIQGDGNAYLDLDCTLNQNDEIEVDFGMPSSAINSKNIFGYRNSASNNNIALMIASTDTNMFVSDFNNSAYATYRMVINSLSANTEYQFIGSKDGRYLYQGSTLVGSQTVACPDTINTGNVYLFNIGGAPAYSNKFNGKISKCVIKGKRNLIPAKRNVDSVLGMYDTLNGVFYTNAGTGNFIEGPKVETYTALEYATFNGTQIVDTGLILNNDSKIESMFNGSASGMWIYGSGTTNPRITAYLMSTGNQRWGNVTVDSTGISSNVNNLLIQSKAGFNLNGTNKPYTGAAAFTAQNTLTIGNSNGSTGTPYFSGKFYYIKIWDNDNLILDCTPAKRDSDGVVGFYDSVNNKFITPSTGVLS